MHDEVPLFSLDDNAPEPATTEVPAPIATWQVDLLRKTLDARGIVEMAERKQVIEQHAGRAVASLKELTSGEAISILSKLGELASNSTSTASAWDQREEDTWIDRL